MILDLLEWIGPAPRAYDEVLEAWRTSCPRLPVWEDAREHGFVTVLHEPGRGRCVAVSAAGWEHLGRHRAGDDGAGGPVVQAEASARQSAL